eukprot:CAMPEP_0178425454 /NCGR_PEP_ID=MMETSP0689_2-20121128/28730_1 /TAXON_ID=160604 /ORGANISM="Amphidinium massartii, Strain CS-259" /LENGTH=185 /DNA_ID=CAMNT_0020047115 /DNA_START=145 /DNA_END=702 /DNA_ORIENTATION=+
MSAEGAGTIAAGQTPTAVTKVKKKSTTTKALPEDAMMQELLAVVTFMQNDEVNTVPAHVWQQLLLVFMQLLWLKRQTRHLLEVLSGPVLDLTWRMLCKALALEGIVNLYSLNHAHRSSLVQALDAAVFSCPSVEHWHRDCADLLQKLALCFVASLVNEEPKSSRQQQRQQMQQQQQQQQQLALIY